MSKSKNDTDPRFDPDNNINNSIYSTDSNNNTTDAMRKIWDSDTNNDVISYSNNRFTNIFRNEDTTVISDNDKLGIATENFFEGLVDTEFTEFLEEEDKVQLKSREEIRVVIENILATEEISTAEKVEHLKQVGKENYKPLIRKLAYKKKIEELKELAEVFKDLGYLSFSLGELTRKLKDYTDSATFYTYSVSIIEERIRAKESEDSSLYDDRLGEIYKELSKIKEKIISSIKLREKESEIKNIKEETVENKKILLELREKARQDIEKIEEYRIKSRTFINNEELGNYEEDSKNENSTTNNSSEDNNNTNYSASSVDSNNNSREPQEYTDAYIREARSLFTDIAVTIRGFLARLYKEAEEEIGVPPCKYSVMGLGSMALQQMTPYSDLEFAIITENEDYKKSDDIRVREYFKNLTHLANLKIICLGETIIPTSRYGIDLSHLVHRGINFDLGGKTPLGRIEKDKPYDLVQTIDKMLWYVWNEEEKASHIDKNLPYILEKVCYVHGDRTLVTEYQSKVTEFLHMANEEDSEQRLNCEIRALKVLQEGAVEFSYMQGATKPKVLEVKGDLEKFQPLSFDIEGKLFDVKQEIYRLPDRLIYNFGQYYGIEGDSTWDTVNKLQEKGYINEVAARNLKYAITFATTLRLKTYLHNKGQIEDMSLFASTDLTEQKVKEETAKILHLPKDDFSENGALFKYYYIIIPLYRGIEGFCEGYKNLTNEEKTLYFEASPFYISEDLYNLRQFYRGLINYKLLKYNAAKNDLERVIELDETNLVAAEILGDINYIFGKIEEAIKKFEFCLASYQRISLNLDSSNSINLLNKLAKAYISIGKFDDAEKCCKSVNDIITNESLESFLINSNIDKATPLINLGIVFHSQNRYPEAIEQYKKALKVSGITLEEKTSTILTIVGPLNNLALVYKDIRKYSKAIKIFKEILIIQKGVFKTEPHPSIAATLNNIGIVYQENGDYDNAIKYHSKSLSMKEKIYSKELTPALAISLENLAIAYGSKEDYAKAIEYNTKSLSMKKEIYQLDPNKLSIAISLNNLGKTYDKMNQYYESIKHYNQALKIVLLLNNSFLYIENIRANLSKVVKTVVEKDAINLKLIIELLLENGAKVEAMEDEDTLMHMAHYKGNKEAIKLLLEHKANINTQNNAGKTPLHCLLEKEGIEKETKLDIIEEFIDKYDSSIKDNANRTVMDYAEEYCPEALSMLLEEDTHMQLAISESLVRGNDEMANIGPSTLPGNIDHSTNPSLDFV